MAVPEDPSPTDSAATDNAATDSAFFPAEPNRSLELSKYIKRCLQQGVSPWELENELAHRGISVEMAVHLVSTVAASGKKEPDPHATFEELFGAWTAAYRRPASQRLPLAVPSPTNVPNPAAATLVTPNKQPGAPPIPPELAAHPRYRVIEMLGEGGMGAVYRAEHLVMQRPVALKVIRGTLIQDAAAAERFAREVRAAATLAHPNIVRAYDADRAGDLHFLVMELIEGMTLAQLVSQRGPLPEWLAADLMRQAAAGLQHAHAQGMVHRDIKPQNMLLTPDGTLKILDFGLARIGKQDSPGKDPALPPADFGPQTDQLTAHGVMMGTPDFVAPEQIRDSHHADIRADIYGLGCTLYLLLTGQTPFPDTTAQDKLHGHLYRAPIPVEALRPNLPIGLGWVVGKMMAKRVGDRFQTPEEVGWALTSFAQELAPRRTGPTIASPFVSLAHTGPVPVINVEHYKSHIRRFGLTSLLASLFAFLIVLLFIFAACMGAMPGLRRK